MSKLLPLPDSIDNRLNDFAKACAFLDHESRIDSARQIKKAIVSYASAATEPLLQHIAELERLRSEDRSHAFDLAGEVERLTRELEALKNAKPCPTCESLARAVMLDQTGQS